MTKSAVERYTSTSSKTLADLHVAFIEAILPEFFTQPLLEEKKLALVTDLAARSSLAIEDHIMYRALRDGMKNGGIINTRYAGGYSDQLFTQGLAESINSSLEKFGQPTHPIDKLQPWVESVSNRALNEILNLSPSVNR